MLAQAFNDTGCRIDLIRIKIRASETASSRAAAAAAAVAVAMHKSQRTETLKMMQAKKR